MFAYSAVAWEARAIHARSDNNNALNGLSLHQEVLQKCSNVFPVRFGLGFRHRIGSEKGSIPTHHSAVSWDPGASEQQPREAQPVHYFSMVLEIRAGHIWW